MTPYAPSPMESSFPESDPTYFSFTDLNGLKDFVAEVIVCAPMDWLRPDDQMNLDRAFVGLRYGLDLTEKVQGKSSLLAQCRLLVANAYSDYREGRDHAGQLKPQILAPAALLALLNHGF